MEGASEQKVAAPVKSKPAGKKLPVDPITIFVVVAVVVLLILAFVAYGAYKKNARETEGLKASVTPESLTANAGENKSLEATATFNGDSIDDSVNATFSWSVNDAALGNFSDSSSRSTVFHAGKIGGSGTIICNVTYTADDGTSSIEVEVSLVVNAPTLAAVHVTPDPATLVFDRAVVFNVTAENSVGDDMTDIPAEDVEWTVWGLPEANVTLNATHGVTVNVTANATGTVLLNVTVTLNGVARSASVTVQVIVAAPVVTLSHVKLPAGAGINWTWTEPSQPLAWNDIRIELTDGTSTINWSITMEGLNSGSLNTSEFAPQMLGTLLIYLNITDVDGNGAVNSTDYFLFTTSGGKFSPISHYDVTLIYEPTMIDVIATMAFNG